MIHETTVKLSRRLRCVESGRLGIWPWIRVDFLGPGEVGGGFHLVTELFVSNAPAVVGLGKVGVYSNRLAVITIRLRTEEVSRV